jgi:DNA-binding transcriptional LysR family regulator
MGRGSTTRRHEPPLPLILVDEPSIYRRYALEALERANIPWRRAYLASNLIGIKAATRAGLGVTPRSMEMLGPDMRVLGEIARKAYDLIRASQGLALG